MSPTLRWKRTFYGLRPVNALAFALALFLAIPPVYGSNNSSPENQPKKETATDVKAVVASTQIDVPDPKGPGTVQLTVTAIETENETELLEALSNQTGQGIVVLQNTAAEGETPVLEAIQITQVDQKAPFFRRLKNRARSWFSQNSDRMTGLMISASSSSSGAMAAYYLAGRSLEHSLYIGGAMLAVATLQATFTKSWSSILSLGSKAPLFIGKKIAQRFNRAVEVPEWTQSVGELIVAASVNVGVTSAVLAATDSYHSLATAAIVGTLGAYDYTVDIALRRLIHRGRVTERQAFRTIRGRVMVGPILETLSLAGFAPAQMVMGVIGLSGLYAIFRGESAYDTIVKSHGRVVRVAGGLNKVGSKVLMIPNDLVSLVQFGPAQKPANDCEALMTKPAFPSHYRYPPDDIQ